MSPKHVVSCSFGKDSIATILLALEHSEPLDEVVYCEVMFDDATSGEVAEHQAFIYQVAIPALEKLCFEARKPIPLSSWERSRAGRRKV